jgi:hypothetical protein
MERGTYWGSHDGTANDGEESNDELEAHDDCTFEEITLIFDLIWL